MVKLALCAQMPTSGGANVEFNTGGEVEVIPVIGTECVERLPARDPARRQ